MSDDVEAFQVFVYCDDPSHAPKRQPIETFVQATGDSGWHTRPRKKRVGRAGHVGSGMHMIGDEPAGTGWALDPEVANADIRTRYELVCDQTPACRRRPAPVREERLFLALNAWRAAGVSELSLSVLAAMLGEQAERNLD